MGPSPQDQAARRCPLDSMKKRCPAASTGEERARMRGGVAKRCSAQRMASGGASVAAAGKATRNHRDDCGRRGSRAGADLPLSSMVTAAL